MSIIEVHPEELLDREQRGELSETERAMLFAHLGRCAPCRLERQLRADFEREQAYPLRASDLTDVIAGALRACELPAPIVPAAPSVPEAAPARRRTPLWQRALVALAACGVLGVGIGYAGAQLGLNEVGFVALLERVGVRGSARLRVQPPRSVAPAPKLREAALPATPEPRPVPVVALPVVAPPGLVPAPSWVAPKRSPRAHARHKPAAAAPVVSKSELTSSLTPSSTPTPGATSAVVAGSGAAFQPASHDSSSVAVSAANIQSAASERAAVRGGSDVQLVATPSRLFERANRARHRGASEAADELYDELRERYPDSPEARLSVAVSARMHLDQGELRAALSGFDRYLAGPDCALHEEAMVGRVRALDCLGRERDARAAAEALLRAHPGTAFRPDAEALIARSERD